jgi:hypothetical protein
MIEAFLVTVLGPNLMWALLVLAFVALVIFLIEVI